MRGIWVLFLLLLGGGGALAQMCTPATIYALCQQQQLCKALYATDGLAGIERALTYFQLRGWYLAWNPPAWQPLVANNGITCDFPGGGDVSTASTQPLSPILETTITALVNYRSLAEGSAGCIPPQIMVCDDTQDICACQCPLGVMCAAMMEIATATTTDNGTAAIVLTSIGLGMMVLFVGVSIWQLHTAYRDLRKMMTERDETIPLSPS